MTGEQRAAELLTATITSLWVGGLVALGMSLLCRCLPMGPASRSRLWTLALGITIASLLFGLPHHGMKATDSPAGISGVPTDLSVETGKKEPSENPGIEESAPAPSTIPPDGDRSDVTFSLDGSLGIALLSLWFAGAILGLIWLGFQIVRLISLKRAGSPPSESLQAVWNEVYRSGGRRIRLLVSRRSQLPAACGYFQPAVVAPEGLCRELNDDETRYLLLHELAHLNRYDDWGLLAHRFIQTLLWWHPVIWYLGRRLEAEREFACDEVVVRDGSRRGYARALVRVAEVSRSDMVELAPGVLRGDLTRRVESLLQIPVPIRPLTTVRAGLIAGSSFALAIWLAPPVFQIRSTSVTLPGDNDSRISIAAHLDSIFAGYADSGFSGSVLLAVGDQVVLEKGYGMADRERGIPATAETRYSVAGFTKMFTAAAILALEEEGRLHVTDSLARFFGPLPGRAGQVTLHQLLTHSDGMTRQNAPVYRSDARAFLRAVSTAPDSFAPGEGYRYNDFGHSVLGVIVEEISGNTYEAFIHDRFLLPASLSRTGFENERGDRFAVEYAGRPGAQYPIPPRSYTWGRRASLGMVSTVGDMYRWVRALDDGRVVSPGVRARMFESHGPTDWGAERGYWWDRVRRRDGSVVWRRVAGTPGMEGEILHDPERGWTAVILVNSRVEWRFRVWDDIAKAVARSGTRSALQ